MTWAQTLSYIGLYIPAIVDADGESPIVGDVDMKGYAKWLSQNYGLEVKLQ